MAQKVPELVLKLQQLAKPTFVNNRWRKGAISPRQLAGIRKSLVASGVHWPPKPLADRSKDKPLKLIKHERTRKERYNNLFFVVFNFHLRNALIFFFFCCREEKIAENMKNMPKMIEEYRAKMRALRQAARDKKKGSEEKRYLQATGKSKGPTWQVFMEERKKKEQGASKK